MQYHQVSYEMVIFDDLALLVSHVIGDNTLTAEERPLKEVVEFLTFVRGRMYNPSDLNIPYVHQKWMGRMKFGDHYEPLKKLTQKYNCTELAERVDFEQGMYLGCRMIQDSGNDSDIQIYALDFLNALRARYPKEWDDSWKFDALLGFAYLIAWGDDDEQYIAYKRALKKAPDPPPPQLLVAVAGCLHAPGGVGPTEEEAISMLKKSLSREMNERAVQILRSIYRLRGDTEEQMYWQGILDEIEGKGLRPPTFLDLALAELQSRPGFQKEPRIPN